MKQGQTRVLKSRTVNAHFFDYTTPDVAFTVGFIWACGSIRTKHRKILRLVCHEDRGERLQHVLELMESRHQLQRVGNRLVVEVGNSRLVQTLTDRFGIPPGRQKEGTIPVLNNAMVPTFANGHLFATGVSSPQHIRWRGHSVVVSWLVEQIRAAIPIAAPRVFLWGGTMSAAWTDANHVREIRNWLGISKMV
jgi:hypothetical protein